MNLCADPDTLPTPEGLAEALRPPLLKVFPAALLGRLVVIAVLSLEPTRCWVRSSACSSSACAGAWSSQHKVPIDVGRAVVDLIRRRCTEVESGGRMIDAILTNTVLPEVSREILRRILEGRPIEQRAGGRRRATASPTRSRDRMAHGAYVTLEGGAAPVAGARASRARAAASRSAAAPTTTGCCPTRSAYLSKHHCLIAERAGNGGHRREHQWRVRRRRGEPARARQLCPAARWQPATARRLSPARSNRGACRGRARAAPDLRSYSPAGASGARPGAAAHERRRVRDRVAAQVVDRGAGAAGAPAQRSDGAVFASESVRGAGSPGGIERAQRANRRPEQATPSAAPGAPDRGAPSIRSTCRPKRRPGQPRRPGPGPASGAAERPPGPGAEQRPIATHVVARPATGERRRCSSRPS